MKKYLIICILMLFIVSPFVFSEQINDWAMSNYDVANTRTFPFTINGKILNNIQNISYGDGSYTEIFKNPPITYDFNGDSYPELIFNDNGIMRMMQYNSSNGNFYYSKLSILSFAPVSSPYVYNTSTKQFIVILSSNTLYLLNENLSVIGSKALSNTRTYANTNDYYNSISPICANYDNTDYCVLKEDNTTLEIFNITNTASITSNSISGQFIYNESSVNYNYVPIIDDETDILNPKVVVICQNGTLMGIESFNLSSGAFYKRNCNAINTTSVTPTMDMMFKDVDSDGGREIIVFATSRGTNQGIYAFNLNYNQVTNYPAGAPSGATIDKGYGFFQSKPVFGQRPSTLAYMQMITPPSTLFKQVAFYPPIDANFGNYFTFGTDFMLFNNALYDYTNNKQTNVSRIAVDSRHILSVYDNKLYDFQITTAKILVNAMVDAPLTYPNVTFYFNNSITKQPLGDVLYDVYDNKGGTSISTIAYNSKSYVGDALENGKYNMSVSYLDGYSSYRQEFNITNGTYNVHFLLTPLTGSNATLNLYFLDSTTIDFVVSNVTYTLHYENTSGAGNIAGCFEYPQLCGSTINGTTKLTNLPSGNFTIFTKVFGYDQKNIGQYADSFYCVGTCSKNILLEPITNVSFNPPYVLGYDLRVKKVTQKASTIGNGVDGIMYSKNGTACSSPYRIVNGTIIFDVTVDKNPCYNQSVTNLIYEDILNPPYICKNQSVYVDVSSKKMDSEVYVIHIDPTYEFEPIVSNGVVKNSTLWIGPFDSVGNYSFLIYGLSKSWEFNSIVYYGSQFVQSLEIDVRDCVGQQFDVNGDLVIIDNSIEDGGKKAGSVGSMVFGYFNNNDYITNLIWFLSVWLIVGLIFGGALTGVTKNPVGFMYGYGVVGFFDTLFFTFIYPLLGGFIFFSAILLILWSLTIRAKEKTIGGG